MTPTLKPGDRFEMTVRGEVKQTDGEGYVTALLDGHSGAVTGFTEEELAAARITILEPELRVGRAVEVASGTTGCILALHNEVAWFLPDKRQEPWTHAASAFRNIPEDE